MIIGCCPLQPERVKEAPASGLGRTGVRNGRKDEAACRAGWSAFRMRRAYPGSVELEHSGVQDLTLLQRGTDRAVEAVLQVEVALPLHDVCEEVAVEGRVLGQEGLEVQLLLGRHELIEADRARRDVRPLPGALPAVVGVRPAVSDALEDHTESLPVHTFRAQPWRWSARLEKP